MKLKDDYLLYDAGPKECIAVATGKEAQNFHGLLRANETAGTIMEYLEEETSEEAIVTRMMEEYEAEEEEIRRGVRDVLGILRSVGALVE